MVLKDVAKNMVDCARTENWKVCIYGLGYLGKRVSEKLEDILHLKIDLYCDRNKDLVDTFRLPGAVGIYREQLIESEKDMLVLLLVDYPYDDEIQRELACNRRLHTLRLRNMAAMDEVIHKFYGDVLYETYKNLGHASEQDGGVKKTASVFGKCGKIAVYTCITDGYDTLRQPDMIEESCDYYVISNDSDMGAEAWKYLDVDAVVPDCSMSAKDKNRYCKMHPHEIFLKYDYTIYLDGSIKIQRPIAHYIGRVGFSGLAVHRHKVQDCIYVDGIFAEWLGVVEKDEIIREMARYMAEGLPKKFGMFECGMIVTDLRNDIGKRLYGQWFEAYQKGAKRDQFSFVYTLWKMGLTADAVGVISPGYNILTNPDIAWDRKAHYR